MYDVNHHPPYYTARYLPISHLPIATVSIPYPSTGSCFLFKNVVSCYQHRKLRRYVNTGLQRFTTAAYKVESRNETVLDSYNAIAFHENTRSTAKQHYICPQTVSITILRRLHLHTPFSPVHPNTPRSPITKHK